MPEADAPGVRKRSTVFFPSEHFRSREGRTASPTLPMGAFIRGECCDAAGSPGARSARCPWTEGLEVSYVGFGRECLVLRFAVLGPIEVVDGDRRVPVDSPKARALLAVLLTEAGRVVTCDRLLELLWGGSPPRGGVGVLRYHVSSLVGP